MADTSFTNAEFLGLAGKGDARFRGMPVSGAGQQILLAAGSTVCAADLPLDAHVMLTATKECWIKFGPDASTTAAVVVDMYLAPNIPYCLKVGKGAGGVPNRRIAAVQAGTGGFLYIMPMLAD